MMRVWTVANSEVLGEVGAMLSRGKSIKIRANGNSMRPFIRGGEDVLVLVPPPACFRKGDVVFALTRSGDYVIHRVTAVDEATLTLMGDANLRQRETVARENVFGVVVALVRDGRERNLTGLLQRSAALLYYLLLPLRRIMKKLANL